MRIPLVELVDESPKRILFEPLFWTVTHWKGTVGMNSVVRGMIGIVPVAVAVI
jgi:hypothetical protein